MSRAVLCKSGRDEGKQGHSVGFEWHTNGEGWDRQFILVETSPGDDQLWHQTFMNIGRARSYWRELWVKGYRRLSEKCKT